MEDNSLTANLQDHQYRIGVGAYAETKTDQVCTTVDGNEDCHEPIEQFNLNFSEISYLFALEAITVEIKDGK